jgi:hypothetical protein
MLMKKVFLLTLLFTSIFLVPQIARAQMPAAPIGGPTTSVGRHGEASRRGHWYDADGVCRICDKIRPAKLVTVAITLHPIRITIRRGGKDAIKG